MADSEKKESIFIRLIKGKSEYDSKKKKFIFPLKNKDSFECHNISYIADPAYDSTFKMLFASNGKEKTLMDFLNSILFPDEDEDEDKIIDLTYLVDEFHKLNQKHNKGMLNTDLACKINTKNGKQYVLCLEMQISRQKDFTKRLFDYGTTLRNFNEYENCYSLGLSLGSEIWTNNVTSERKKDSQQTQLNYIKLIEIDISEEINKMKQNKTIKIKGKKIKNKGKEYIKLLGIRKWGEKSDGRYKIPEPQFVSSNEIFINCLFELSAITQIQIYKMELDEHYFLENMNEQKEKGKEEGIIISSFYLFKNGHEDPYSILEENNIYANVNEIKEILKNENKKKVDVYIQFLKNVEYFK